MSNQHAQQPDVGVYFKVWGLLFVLAATSYCISYFGVGQPLKAILLLALALLQAGLIVAVLMHLVWERVIVAYLMFVPPILLASFLAICFADGGYTHGTRSANYLATPLPSSTPAAAPAESH
jgi:cytochrome c oxidase subunit IV